MAQELVLKSACSRCGATADLYGSECRHLTICPACGKAMAEAKAPCADCGAPVLRLVREFPVRAHPLNKQYFVGRFLQGLPIFSKKKSSDSRWTMQREGFQGRQPSEAMREKYKSKPWILEDDSGQQQFQGQLEGGQQASYYLLMMHGKDFLAMPAGAWYNFHKLVQYKQLTLEEAEEQMKNRRRTADGYQRWMMKAANTGAAAFGDVEKLGGGGLGGRRKDDAHDVDEDSDKGDEDEDAEEARRNKLGMNKGSKGEDGDEDDPARGEDMDLDDEDIEKGDDWEHEETFTDDDEAVGNDPEEREDQAPELPAPPEIKQEEEEEDEGEENQQEEGGGLSKSGRELKKLLGKATGLDDSDADEDEEEDEDVDLDNEDIGLSPVLAPKRRDAPKDEPSESPAKASVPGSGRPSQAASLAKGKRKSSNEEKVTGSGATKKAKVEATREVPKSQPFSTTKKEPATTASAAKAGTAASVKTPALTKAGTQAPIGVTEEEVKRVLQQTGPLKSQDLVARFKSRLKAPEDRNAFAVILKKISRIQKRDGTNYIVLRDEV